ncbi:MAG: hypothetical protein GY809_07035, partial [Planctomycetes bacterium]|nr:hypothetical protein [Planctomycetota bacterium]
MRNRIVIAVALSVVGLAGCHGPLRGKVVPGLATFQDAAAALKTQVATFEPTQLYGTCKLDYLDEGGKWRRTTPFRTKLWLEPPHNLHVQILAAPGPEGKIFLGANQEAFWLSIKPEINTYWFGRWDDVSDVTTLELNPRVVLESLGMIQFAPHETWRLENKKRMDVLTCRETTSNRVVKRFYVATKTYKLSQVEYYDAWGDLAVSVELQRYKVLDGKNSVPKNICV